MIEQHNLLNEVADLVDAGKLRTTLTRRLEPIHAANLRQAHIKVESGSASRISAEWVSRHASSNGSDVSSKGGV